MDKIIFKIKRNKNFSVKGGELLVVVYRFI